MSIKNPWHELYFFVFVGRNKGGIRILAPFFFKKKIDFSNTIMNNFGAMMNQYLRQIFSYQVCFSGQNYKL